MNLFRYHPDRNAFRAAEVQPGTIDGSALAHALVAAELHAANRRAMRLLVTQLRADLALFTRRPTE